MEDILSPLEQFQAYKEKFREIAEKTFEERLLSLKKGCIILGVLQAFSVYSALFLINCVLN